MDSGVCNAGVNTPEPKLNLSPHRIATTLTRWIFFVSYLLWGVFAQSSSSSATVGSSMLWLLSPEKCNPANLISPLDIQLPLTHRNFSFNFTANRITGLEMVRLRPNVYRISGDYGTMFYEGVKHKIYNLHIKTPSDHKINGVSYPLEFQYSAVSVEGTEILLSILFERNDFNPLPILYNYGLGNPALKDLPTFDQDPVLSKLAINSQLSLEDFIDISLQDKNGFFIYEGSNPNSVCGLAINMVLAEPLWVGSEQLSVLNMSFAPDYVALSNYKTVIYQNMYNESMPMLHNATRTMHKMQPNPIPGPLTHLPFLFMHEKGKMFGNLNETFYPSWREKPKDGIFIQPEVPPFRKGGYDFLNIGWRQFKLNATNLTIYVAQYVMVTKGVVIPPKVTPKSLPLYLRANYTFPNGMRPIIEIQVKINETERVSPLDRKSNMNMICRKYWMTVVLNRNFDQESNYANISDAMKREHLSNVCADYVMLSDEKLNELKEQPKEDILDTRELPPSKPPSNPSNPSAPSNPANPGQPKPGSGSSSVLIPGVMPGVSAAKAALLKELCSTQLHIVVNRRGADGMGDYYSSACPDPTVPQVKSESKQAVQPQGAVSFAEVNVQRIHADRLAAELMNGQIRMTPLE